jgi:hypothetical protein
MRLRPPELLVLFAIGAAGGLAGDAGHVQAGTTTYLDDTPKIWESALWFPILVGLATASLGELRLRLGPPRPGFDLRLGAAAIASVLTIYAVSALVYDQPEGPATTLVLMLAVLVVCWLADTPAAIACGLIAAVAGPVAEVVIVKLDLAEYAESADSLFGVALWLPALYLAFGVLAAGSPSWWSRGDEFAARRRSLPVTAN